MAPSVDLSELTPIGLWKLGRVLAYAIRLAERAPATARVDILPKGAGDEIGFRVRLAKSPKSNPKTEAL